LGEYEPGMTTAEVEAVFADVRAELVPIVEALAEAPRPDTRVLHRRYPTAGQQAFGEAVLRDLGYDFARGRLDVSAHPFTTTFDVSDVRLTTRYDERFFPTAFFGTVHEAGHGLYEQGIDAAFARTPLADGTSLGMHESQSRLWENLVARSRPFWRRYLPVLRQIVPAALQGVDADAFYRAVNLVEPSLIRVEADEVTYPLHVMLRFELERGLVTGAVDVETLPARWNAKMEDDLGVVPDTDADGVLQDIHWALGAIGYFPTYALGTLMSVPLFEAARADLADAGHGALDDLIAAGTFGPLLGWLRRHVHRHGRAKTATEILTDATGGPLDAAPWLAYVRRKYGALYDVDLGAA
jgi:carboxypeptidase Taq